MTTLKIVNLHHDFNNKRSLVTVVWEHDPDKRLVWSCRLSAAGEFESGSGKGRQGACQGT
jgi:hypothetical protein